MNKLYIICLLTISCSLSAQTPQFYKGLGTSNSTFLLGYASYAAKSQCIFTAADFQSPVAGMISRIYYRYGSTGQTSGQTMYGFGVSFVQVADTDFIGGNQFFTGTVNTLSVDSLIIPPGVTGDWFPIDLTSPFPYDPSMTLVVQLTFDSSLVNTFGTLGTSNSSERKLISADKNAVTGDATTGTWQDFGFDEGTVGIENPASFSSDDISIVPNPFSNSFYVLCDGQFSDANIFITDMTGRIIYQRSGITENKVSVSMQDFANGIYFMRLRIQETDYIKRLVKD